VPAELVKLIEDAKCLASHARRGIGNAELGEEHDRARRSVDGALPLANGLLVAALGLKGIRQQPPYAHMVGIDVKSTTAVINAAVPVLEEPKHRFVTDMDYRRQRIQLERSPVLCESFFQSAHAAEAVTVPHVREISAAP
jgi:hypothetical protein